MTSTRPLPLPLPLPCPHGPVLLRRLRPADLADFQAYRRDAEVARLQGWSPMSDADALAFIVDMAAADGLQPGAWWQLGIAEAASDRLVGDLGLHLAADRDEAELGFSLARPAQGRGWAVQALAAVTELLFAHTPIARIVAVTDARNAAAIRLLERLEFRLADSQPAVFKGESCVEHRFVLDRPAAA